MKESIESAQLPDLQKETVEIAQQTQRNLGAAAFEKSALYQDEFSEPEFTPMQFKKVEKGDNVVNLDRAKSWARVYKDPLV